MDNPVNDFVCASIRRHRQAKGLRVVDMARRTGIPLGSYSCLETNRCRISLIGEFHAKPQSRKERKDKKIKGFLTPLDSGIGEADSLCAHFGCIDDLCKRYLVKFTSHFFSALCVFAPLREFRSGMRRLKQRLTYDRELESRIKSAKSRLVRFTQRLKS